MKKIALLFLFAFFICMNLSVSAEESQIDKAQMMTNIEKLSSQPRGYKNDEIQYARQLITDTFYKYNLQVYIQSFETTLMDNKNNMYKGINIIGTKKPNTNNNTNDVLLITAHYDGANDMPAANDNASGIAVMLELVKVLHRIPTDTEIRFIAFDCEEAGLLGSEYYANSITNEADNIIGMLNFDMLGAKSSDGVHIYSGDECDNYLFDILKSTPYFSDVQIDRNSITDNNSVAVTSDYASFKSKLIPTLSFSNLPIEEEMHSKNDTIDNINPDMLEYAVQAGKVIAENIMSVSTSSYAERLHYNPSDAVYTIPVNYKFPFGEEKKRFAELLGIELEPIISNTTKLQYQANVRLFNMQQSVKLIVEENAFMPDIMLSNVMECKIDTGSIPFDEILKIITESLGTPIISENVYRIIYTWNDIIYGNQYSLVIADNNFQLSIYPYIGEQQSYAIQDGNLIRLEKSSIPRETLIVSKYNDKYISTIKYPEPSKSLPITKEANAVWNKIKSKLSPQQISQIGYISLNTNGIGGGDCINITMAESAHIVMDNIISKMKNENLDYLKTDTYLGKTRIYVDYIDLLHEKGHCYNDNELQKDIAIAYVKCLNNIDSPSLWAVEPIVNAIRSNILPIELAEKYTADISRLDFCKIAYQLFPDDKKLLDCPIPFSDTNSKEIEFLSAVGIISGKTEKTFAPNDYITREEAATILTRITDYFKKSSITDTKKIYSDDYYIADWAKDSVYSMQQCNIMIGTDNNKFEPQTNYTKEQAIATIMRLYNILNKH